MRLSIQQLAGFATSGPRNYTYLSFLPLRFPFCLPFLSFFLRLFGW